MLFVFPQAGYTTIQSVDQKGILHMGTPNREVREMLEAEHLQMLTGSLHPEDVAMFASELIDGNYEAARVVLERMIKNTPPEKQPKTEGEFSLVVCWCTQKLPDLFLATYINFQQELGEEPKTNAGRPDVCMVFAHNETTRALVIELKFGAKGDSAAKGLKQIVDRQYVERSVVFVNTELAQSRPDVPLLQPHNVSSLCFKLNKDKSVTLKLPEVAAPADAGPSTGPAAL